MARTLQHLTLFLASPGDVGEERKVVREVVDEVNRSFARERGVHLEVIGWDTDSFPSYGKDAQAILNDQIANMAEHDLFVGILWNRFGTPTPRAESGAEEEFNRAEESNRTTGSPHIMFYFCQRATNLRSQTDLEQKSKILQFRGRIQKDGLTSDYTEVSEFRVLFQRHLQLWLATRTATTPNPPPAATASVSSGAVSVPPSVAPPTNAVVSSPAPATSAALPSPPESEPHPLAEQVNESGAWVLLGTEFYESDSVIEKNDGSAILEITPRNAEEDAALRSLQTGAQRRGGDAIPFAYQNSAGIATVTEADRRSASGRNYWTISVRVEERQTNFFSEVAFNNLSTDDIAALRARLILLNENAPLTGNGRRIGRADLDLALHQSFIRGSVGGGREAPEVSPFLDLWQRFKGRSDLFLPLARLWAAYHLLTTNTVEHILDLTLGPVHDGKLHVRFRGRRHKRYTNVDPVEIEVDGDCDLSAAPSRQ